MLEIKCGAADRSHENRFFRYFATQLKEAFGKTGRDGILLGMPECKVRDNLQMDALLITDSSLSIIDFKDYGDCEVALPGEGDFDSGLWRTSEGVTVRGGSSRNPYAQLMRQRRLLKGILDSMCRHKTGSFDSAHITTMVCFAGRVTISGAIPGRERLKFFVADSESFLERIHDIVNVHGVGLLGSEFATRMIGILFDAQPFDCEMKPSEPFPTLASQEPQRKSAGEPSPQADPKHTNALRSFFRSDQDVLIISATDPAVRARLALSAQAEAHDAGFGEAPILSPTKLAGDSLCGGLPLDGSLYSEIYDFGSRVRGEGGVEHVALGKIEDRLSLQYEDSQTTDKDESARAPRNRTTLIVCESQLVTSEGWLDGPVVFGSGRLLDDTLAFLEMGEGNKGANKVVFIGDDCQLGVGSPAHSSMREEAYPQGVRVRREVVDVEEPSDGYSEFVNRLANSIRASEHSLLSANEASPNPRIADGGMERTLIEDAAESWRTHKIVTYTHEHANKLNLYIKRRILGNGNDLCRGDVLVFNDVQFDAVPCEPSSIGLPTRRMRNGEFAKVSRVGEPLMRLQVDAGEDGPGMLTIVPIRFYPEGCSDEYEACLILEYLTSPKGRLSSEEEAAIKKRMDEIERAKRQEMPFCPGNHWYELMVSEGGYVELRDGSGAVRYRQESDRRKLTPQESEYRAQIERMIDVPGSEYHALKNLARARYGWAMTAHKAQYYRWDTVTLSAMTYTTLDSGRSSDAYFRFLYTGGTRAREQLYIVKWEDVSPFCKAEFDASPSNVRKKAKRPVLFRASPGMPVDQQIVAYLNMSQLTNIQVEHSASSNWREAFTFTRGGSESVLAFDYNKAGDVFCPRRERGDTGLFTEVSDALAHDDSEDAPESAMRAAYDYAEELDARKTSISVVKADRYRDEIRVENQTGSFFAAVYHGEDRVVSRVELQSGDKGAFDAFRHLLIKTDESSGR